MKYAQLAEIHSALTALGEQPLDIFYEIAKNLRRVKAKIKEIEADFTTINEKYGQKDENGEFVYETVPVFDPVTGGTRQIQRYTFNKENKPLQKAEAKKVEEDEHEVDFHRIDIARLNGKSVKANLIEPLLDVVFIEGDLKEKK